MTGSKLAQLPCGPLELHDLDAKSMSFMTVNKSGTKASHGSDSFKALA
jgi:hypothetical protein